MGHQDGDGRCVPGPGGQVEWAVSTMVPQIHLEAVRLHMLGQPGHQIDLRSVAREKERKNYYDSTKSQEGKGQLEMKYTTRPNLCILFRNSLECACHWNW